MIQVILGLIGGVIVAYIFLFLLRLLGYLLALIAIGAFYILGE